MTRKTAQKKAASPKKAAPPKEAAANEITRKVPRSAKSGLFVTFDYAESHPSTTEVETIKVKQPSPKKKPRKS